MTEELFREDAYLKSCEAAVVAVTEEGVVLDRTVFYPMGGGQPGDIGVLSVDGTDFTVTDTRKSEAGILHLVEGDKPATGAKATATVDWDRRHRLMRVHSAMHLLCSAIDGAVTGGQVGDGKGRLDFDLPDTNLDKQAIGERINAWIGDDRPLSARWITEAELDGNPDLVRTMSVRPPTRPGQGASDGDRGRRSAGLRWNAR